MKRQLFAPPRSFKSIAASTAHGRVFEDVVVEFVQREAEKAGDIATATGNSTRFVKSYKVGDATVELGPGFVAQGSKFVVEARSMRRMTLPRHVRSYRRPERIEELQWAYSFSKKTTAPANKEPLLRYGNDIFVVWHAEDINNDVVLKSALWLTKGLCVRESKTREAEAADFQVIDSAILANREGSKATRINENMDREHSV